jgi:hypothetical protein
MTTSAERPLIIRLPWTPPRCGLARAKLGDAATLRGVRPLG